MNELIDMMLNISQEIKTLKAYIEVYQKTRYEKFTEAWLDGQEIMLALKISKRTLQSLRDSKSLPYSRINGKFYYKLSDLERMLESNYSSFKSDNNGTK